MGWLSNAIIELGTRLFNYIFGGSKQQDATGPGKFEDQAKQKMKKEGWGIFIIVAILSLSGCTMFTRTVYVPDGSAIRLRQDLKNVKIWAKQKDGATAEGRMDIPEGWFCFYNPDWEEVK